MFLVAGLWLQVQMGAIVRPETVTVGQHFNATVRVRVPAGAQLRFPLAPDSSARIDTAGPTQRRVSSNSQFAETTVNYVLAAWDTGTQSLGLGDVAVMLPSGQRLASLRALSVYVKSVLPADTSQRKPKAPRPVLIQRVINWIPWAVAALVALLLAALLWFWRRKRARSTGAVAPLTWAEREFERIERSGWLEAGEPERYAIGMVEVVRRYLSLIDPVLAASLTTRELAVVMERSAALPVDRLVMLFESIDPLKFAARVMSRDGAAAAGSEARALVSDVDRRLAEAEAARSTQAGARRKAA